MNYKFIVRLWTNVRLVWKWKFLSMEYFKKVYLWFNSKPGWQVHDPDGKK